MLHTNGNWITILSRAMAMRDNEGELTGMIIGTHLDITSIQETAENLISTQKEFEKSKKQIIKDNAFLKAILNSPKDLFIIAIGKKYEYLGFSDAYISFAKNVLNKEVALGMNVFDVLPAELHSLAKTNYDRALAGENFVANNSVALLDGKRKYYENKYSPIIDQNGHILGLTLFANDVTAIKLQLEETRIVDLRYAALFDGAEDAILIADAATGTLVDINGRALELFGYSRAEMIGMHQTKLHPPEDLEYVIQQFKEFTNDSSFKTVETRIINSKGKIKSVRITGGAPFRVGKYQFTAAYFHDVTIEKAAIEKALTIQELLSKAEGIAHVGSFEVSLPDGSAVWSDEMFRILDLTPNEVIAHPDVFSNLVLPTYLEQYEKWIATAKSIEGESKPIKIEIKTAKGNLKHIIISGISYKNKVGFVYKYIGVVKDITTRVITLEGLQQQNQRLREIAWAQSHMVRGPLSDILGISKIIKQGLVTEEEKENLLLQMHETAEKLDLAIKEVVNNTNTFETDLKDFE
jgi:PAS domain S-box-containing protein